MLLKWAAIFLVIALIAAAFGFGGIDIKSYYMGLTGKPWSSSTSSQLPPEFLPDMPQTHNALDDARAQASIFAKMLKASRPAS